MVKLADTRGLGPRAARRRGSNPLLGTGMNVRLTAAKIFLAVLIVGGFFYVSVRFEDPDLGWHVRVGEWISMHRAVPHADEYSHTMKGYRWVDHEWALDAALWSARERGLWAPAVFLFSLAGALPFLYVLFRSRFISQLLIAPLGASAVLPFVGMRPQLFTWMFFALTVWCLGRYCSTRRARFLFLVPALIFIWSNIHAGFFAGMGAVVLVLGSDVIVNRFAVRAETLRNIFVAIVTAVACAIVPLFNPYGVELYGEVFRVLASRDTAAFIAEWRSILFFVEPSIALFFAVSVFLMFVMRRLLAGKNILPAVFLVGAVKAARNWPLYVIAAMPVVIEALEHFENIIEKAQRGRSGGDVVLRRWKYVLACLVFAVSVAFFYQVVRFEGITYPHHAVLYLSRAENRWGNIFNPYEWGGYIENNAPGMRVFIDGRMPHWIAEDGSSAMSDYSSVVYKKDDSWKEVFERRNITTVIAHSVSLPGGEQKNASGITNRIAESSFGLVLRERLEKDTPRDLVGTLRDAGWETVYSDSVAVIMVRPPIDP